jgi:hypothetical protein
MGDVRTFPFIIRSPDVAVPSFSTPSLPYSVAIRRPFAPCPSTVHCSQLILLSSLRISRPTMHHEWEFGAPAPASARPREIYVDKTLLKSYEGVPYPIAGSFTEQKFISLGMTPVSDSRAQRSPRCSMLDPFLSHIAVLSASPDIHPASFLHAASPSQSPVLHPIQDVIPSTLCFLHPKRHRE